MKNQTTCNSTSVLSIIDTNGFLYCLSKQPAKKSKSVKSCMERPIACIRRVEVSCSILDNITSSRLMEVERYKYLMKLTNSSLVEGYFSLMNCS